MIPFERRRAQSQEATMSVRVLMDIVGFLAGLVALVSIFVPSTVIKQALEMIAGASVRSVPVYCWILVLPAFYGVLQSRKFGGFSRMSARHLLASAVIYPFWVGVAKGTKIVGLIAAAVVLFLLVGARFAS